MYASICVQKFNDIVSSAFFIFLCLWRLCRTQLSNYISKINLHSFPLSPICIIERRKIAVLLAEIGLFLIYMFTSYIYVTSCYYLQDIVVIYCFVTYGYQTQQCRKYSKLNLFPQSKKSSSSSMLGLTSCHMKLLKLCKYNHFRPAPLRLQICNQLTSSKTNSASKIWLVQKLS